VSAAGPGTAAVVGGGVIGLSCARALAARGTSVTLFEGSSEAREASWAAAGILGAGCEHASDSPLFRLGLDAFRLWPETLSALRAETGIDAGFHGEGTVLVALEEADLADLDARARFLAAAGFPAERWDPAALAREEPAVTRDALGGLSIREGRLDNRALWRAYDASCRARGVAVRTGEPVLGLASQGERVVGVRTPAGEARADAVVLASGAWSEALGRAAGVALPTVPVKGHIARVEAPAGLLSRIVKRGPRYAVPREGAGLLLGTTAETVGFDRSVDPGAIAGILEACARLVPALSGARAVETWAGLRPRLEDGAPAIGAVRSRPGLFVATGHFRNGILLAEVTGRMVADAVLGRTDPRAAAFSPERFGA
jgi:glycine oxidase